MKKKKKRPSRTPSQAELIDSGLVNLSGLGATRAEDAQGTPTQTQSRISPGILVYEDYNLLVEGRARAHLLPWVHIGLSSYTSIRGDL